ncbi:hypothetical protein GCM10010176_020130 [Nonomuraea spiralis]|nr:hypothetical protein GCM10010176_020130 [Nonomuraea spiralis]
MAYMKAFSESIQLRPREWIFWIEVILLLDFLGRDSGTVLDDVVHGEGVGIGARAERTGSIDIVRVRSGV